jgi:hypothetical protein
MKHLLPTLPLLALVFSAGSCGSADPKAEGMSALQASDYGKAAVHLETALASLDPGSPDYMEVAMGRCKALAHTDSQKAKAEFEKLATSQDMRVADYSEIVSHLLSAKQFMPAIEIMDGGLKKFPGDPKMILIKEKVVAQSKQAADPAAMQTLKGLGYLGGD